MNGLTSPEKNCEWQNCVPFGQRSQRGRGPILSHAGEYLLLLLLLLLPLLLRGPSKPHRRPPETHQGPTRIPSVPSGAPQRTIRAQQKPTIAPLVPTGTPQKTEAHQCLSEAHRRADPPSVKSHETNSFSGKGHEANSPSGKGHEANPSSGKDHLP